MTTLAQVLEHLGTGQQRVPAHLAGGPLLLNGRAASRPDCPEPGDVLNAGARAYRIVRRLDGTLYPVLMPRRAPAARPVHLHAGLHKNLTMFTRKVYDDVIRAQQKQVLQWARNLRFPQQKHFFHMIDDFYDQHHRFTQTSLSGQLVDLDSFPDIRVVRFVRDPRDLLISGYHYHMRGVEHWCKIPRAVHGDYALVGGAVPEALQRAGGVSLQEYLQSVSLADGLRAEFAFRVPHFDAMMAWPAQDARVLTLRYEDIMGSERNAFAAIADHLGWHADIKAVAERSAYRYSDGGEQAAKGHVRDKRPGQWRSILPEDVAARVTSEYGALLSTLGYPLD